MNLFYQPLINQGIHKLDPTESRHCTKVLRKKAGDKIHVTDGKGFLYIAQLTIANPDQCSFDVIETKSEEKKTHQIHIAISPTKHADRFEWFVEKAVEVGVDIITIMNCERTEHSHIKSDRLEKIAISAMKQSLRFTLPRINGPLDFETVLDQANAGSVFIAHVDNDNPNHLKNIAHPGSEYLVLIGPEGDFSSEELKMATVKKFQKVSLGSNRLRSETAGLVA